MTKAAALNAGEADWWENPPPDLVPVLAANPDVTVANRPTRSARSAIMRLQPPAAAVRQCRRCARRCCGGRPGRLHAGARRRREELEACPSFFTCGTPMASDAGSEALTGKRDFDKAKKLITEAGYKGEKIVVLVGDRSADRAQPGAGGHRAAEKARPQCRARGDGLGHADHPPRLEGADRQGRLEHLRHRLGRPRHARPGGQRPMRGPARRRGSAGPPTPRSRSCATHGSRRPIRRRRRSSATRSRNTPSRSVPYIPTANSSSRPPIAQHLGPPHLPDRLPLERREEVGSGSI